MKFTIEMDILAKVILKFTHKSAWKFSLWIAVYAVGCYVVSAPIFGGVGNSIWWEYLKWKAVNADMLLWIFIIPLIMYFFLWQSQAQSTLYNKLEEAKIWSDTSSNTSNNFKGAYWLARWHRDWRWSVLFVGITLGLAFTLWRFNFIAPLVDSPVVSTVHIESLVGLEKIDPIGILLLPLALMCGYAVQVLIWRSFALIKTLNLAFAELSPNLNPFHHDKCGGLGALNQYVITFGYLIVTCGFGLGLMLLNRLLVTKISSDWFLFLLIGVYVVAVPTLFFGTLGTAHRAMKKARDEYLQSIAQHTHSVYDSLVKILKDENDTKTGDVKQGIERLDTLGKLADLTRQFPVWPFDTTTVRRFLSFFVISIAPSAISIVINLR